MHDSGRATGAYTKIACTVLVQRAAGAWCARPRAVVMGETLSVATASSRSSNIARVHNRRQKVQENQHIQASRARSVPALHMPDSLSPILKPAPL
jgi:hypothetical protein